MDRLEEMRIQQYATRSGELEGKEEMDELQANLAFNYEQIRKSNDSAAILRVNRNTVEILQSMGLGIRGAA